jgi:hypothetical protein
MINDDITSIVFSKDTRGAWVAECFGNNTADAAGYIGEVKIQKSSPWGQIFHGLKKGIAAHIEVENFND